VATAVREPRRMAAVALLQARIAFRRMQRDSPVGTPYRYERAVSGGVPGDETGRGYRNGRRIVHRQQHAGGSVVAARRPLRDHPGAVVRRAWLQMSGAWRP